MADYLISPSTGSMWNNVQRPLSQAQAVPILGLIPSALKAVVSAVQLAVGFAFTLLYAVASWVAYLFSADKSDVNETLVKNTIISGTHGLMGLAGLVYSIANIISLTGLSFCIEGNVRSIRTAAH